MKLNIGCGQSLMEGYFNIDNGQDSLDLLRNMLVEAKKTGETFLIMDGNKMTFLDEMFEEVYSNQCVGIYVTDFKGIVRVMKHGGKIRLGVWANKVGFVLAKLIEQNVRITGVEWMNGRYADIESEEYTLMLEGVKT